MYPIGTFDLADNAHGEGGMEVFDGTSWLPADGWDYYAEAGEIDFVWFSLEAQPGRPWRLQPGFNVTIDGNPISPREGTMSAPPEMLAGSSIDAKRLPSLRKTALAGK
jgi:hypothetical protein